MFNYKLKLMIIVGLFGLLLTFTVSFVDQLRFTNQLKKDYDIQTSLIQDNILTAISDVDKAHILFEMTVEKKMEKHSNELIEKYKNEPDFETWDYQSLKKDMDGLDIYIINAENLITHSSYQPDIGLDLAKVTPELSVNLDYMRNKGKFVVNAMDTEMSTARIRKYSYIPTPDGKNIIQLGYVLTNTQNFELFSFVEVIERMKIRYEKVDDIIVYSADGKSLGSVDKTGRAAQVPKEFTNIFNVVKDKKKVVREVYDDGIIHEFIPYTTIHMDENLHYTDLRIIEIRYNSNYLNGVIQENKHVFLIQFLVIFGVSLFIAFLITKIISKPMYLASYDLLTGLFNRFAFYTHLDHRLKRIKKSKDNFSVLMLDLDNFKLVNDTLGHDGGDHLLKEVARRIETSLRGGKDIVARLGGDEFGVILDDVQTAEDAKKIASRILSAFELPLIVKGKDLVEDLNISASIGIVLVPEHGKDSKAICKHGDIAMYHAKNAGKNTFKVYDNQYHKENKRH